jgi:drug/metabolite transporter (DMT)-like permease
MSHALATVVFGLAASLFWGSGDFSGGLASRRDNASSVVFAAYAVGAILLVALALIWREPFPSPLSLLWGGLAGIAGTIGLVAFYKALALGHMGIIAPVSAILTAGFPVIFSAFTEGLPSLLQVGGFVLALLAIGLISRPERAQGRPEGIGLALLAGCMFGCYFIFVSRLNATSTFWPLAAARLVSMLFLLVLGHFQLRKILPKRRVIPLVVFAGAFDATGNAFFVLATHIGRLDVAAVLSSLYPAATVLLAAIVVRERVTRIQAVGILCALVAIPLISAKL